MLRPLKAPHIQSLRDIDFLSSHFGRIEKITRQQINTRGYSGATFEQMILHLKSGEARSMILKEVDLEKDWFSHRTKDITGREAAALLEPATSAIHQLFHTPYQIIAMEERRIALLMDDLGGGLFPDEKKPLALEDQDLILDKLARMHAYYWESPKLTALNWLHSPKDFFYIMGPRNHTGFEGSSPRNIQETIRSAWTETLPLLPSYLRSIMLQPPGQIIAFWADLPKTLVHGDTKVANFGKNHDGNLTLFDWAFAGHAPCTFDIGWFLAVNASRLAQPKEMVLAKYRLLLERHLEQVLENALWNRLEQAGIVCGSFMLLWSKGSALAAGKDGATEEWNWWLQRLRNWAFELR